MNARELGSGRPADVNMGGGAAGIIATPRSYAVFLDALTNGTLLGPTARQELDESYRTIFNIPGVYDFANGFGLFKEVFRGFPGSADYDLLNHGGILPGARCYNAVLTRPTGASAPFTGVLCFNSASNYVLLDQPVWDLLNIIADPATYGTP